MLNILKFKIEQCNNYTDTLNSLEVQNTHEKQKINSIIKRTHIVQEGLNKLLKTLYDVWDNSISVNPEEVSDMIVIDTVLTLTPYWPLAMHLFTGFFCLGCSAFFHLCQIKN